MKKILLLAVVVIAGLGLCLSAAAEDKIKPGEAVQVKCLHDSSQSYACYLPKKYDKKKKWNILYCFSPGGNGMGFVNLYMEVCEKHGWIVVGSNNARNGPVAPIWKSINAVWKDTHKRFSLDEKGHYSSGFSGGSGMAFWLAEKYPDNWSGVIPMAVAGSWAEKTPDLPVYVSVFFIIGDRDGTIKYCKKHAKVLKEKGNQTEIKLFSGGHQPPPKETAAEAVEWMVKIQDVVRLKSMLGDAEKLLKDKMPYHAKKAFKKLVDKYPKSDEAKKAKERIKAIDSDKSLQNEMKAGKMFDRGLEHLKKGKRTQAVRTLRVVITKYPDTEYAKHAKTKIDEIKAEDMFNTALKLEEKGKKEDAEKAFKKLIKKYPDTTWAEKARKKVE